jgi:hypothetical protein
VIDLASSCLARTCRAELALRAEALYVAIPTSCRFSTWRLLSELEVRRPDVKRPLRGGEPHVPLERPGFIASGFRSSGFRSRRGVHSVGRPGRFQASAGGTRAQR